MSSSRISYSLAGAGVALAVGALGVLGFVKHDVTLSSALGGLGTPLEPGFPAHSTGTAGGGTTWALPVLCHQLN